MSHNIATHDHGSPAGVRDSTSRRGRKLGAIALSALILSAGLGVSPALANGGAGGVPGTGHGSSGAWQLYDMSYDAQHLDGSFVQGQMGASTEWFINNYPGPNANGAGGQGAKDAVRQACALALEQAEARGGYQGMSRVVSVFWAGSATNAWESYSSASSAFFQQRWDNFVGARGMAGIYTGPVAQAKMQELWPTGLAQGGSTPSAVCIALNQDEPPQFTFNPPVKTLTKADGTELADDQVLASGQMYQARIAAPANGRTGEMSIWDEIMTEQVWIGGTTADDASQVRVLDASGNAVPSTISITRAGGKTVVSGSVQVARANARDTFTLVVPTYVQPTKSDYTIRDGSFVTYAGDHRLDGNEEVTRKVTPRPDKVWVLDESGALVTADPGHTNQAGSDEKTFLPGDAVSAVVNGRVPGKLATNLSKYQIIDDWSDAATYVDFSDAAKAKVFYETGVGTNEYTNVTSQFDVSVSGTVTTATAKPAFLGQTAGQSGDRKVKLVVSGNFRTDYDTQGEIVKLTNAGSEVWNNETIPTNEPPVYTWTPDPVKEVVGSGEEAGDNTYDNIHGMSVWPGQKIEYSVGIDLRIPSNTARGVKSLAVEDAYDPMFTPDKSSVEFWDSRDPKNPRPVPKSNYALVFDEAANKFTATFTQEWIDKNVNVSGANSEWAAKPGWLTMRFTGTVKDNAAGGSTVRNQAFQIINGARTATEIPEVEIPQVTPDKEDLNTDLIDIDGKTVVKGDKILYRLTLDGGPAKDKMAYYVHKLGMVDDFDEDYLDLDESRIKVTEKDTGTDVTAKFNIQVKNGIAYVFAKQVDYTNAFGKLIPGDPQPTDLAAYDQAPIIPHETPIIDQDLLGKQYWITLETTVTKEVKDYVIKNQARQNIQNTHHQTRIVSNPLTAINPDKDVVIDAGDADSINGTEVALNDLFNYRLNSSEIPANRAYNASSWGVSDAFDRVHDSYTGKWAVYAQTDLYDGDELVAKAGDLLQDDTSVEKGDPEYFTVSFDEASYTLTAAATPAYLDLVNSRGDLPQAWSLYTKMERIAPGEKIVNRFTEVYNDIERPSNEVHTRTPEDPAIELVKYTLREGLAAGDRDTDAEALQLTDAELKDGVEVGVKIRNTGNVPLTNVQISDRTHDGRQGTLENLVCETIEGAEGEVTSLWIPAAQITELAVGQEVDCKGTLKGMGVNDFHTDTATVTGESVFTGKKVSADDPWNAKAPVSPLAQTGATGIAALAGLATAFIGGAAALITFGVRRNRKLQAGEIGGDPQ